MGHADHLLDAHGCKPIQEDAQKQKLCKLFIDQFDIEWRAAILIQVILKELRRASIILTSGHLQNVYLLLAGSCECGVSL